MQPTQPETHRQLSLCLAEALPLLQRHLFTTVPASEYQVGWGDLQFVLAFEAGNAFGHNLIVGLSQLVKQEQGCLGI